MLRMYMKKEWTNKKCGECKNFKTKCKGTAAEFKACSMFEKKGGK
jgi:hypothetical protein